MFKRKFSSGHILKIIFVLWIIFATVYVVYGEYNRLANFVAKRAYNAGLQEAVTKIITESQKCQPIPVNVGEMKATLINLECLKQPVEEAEE